MSYLIELLTYSAGGSYSIISTVNPLVRLPVTRHRSTVLVPSVTHHSSSILIGNVSEQLKVLLYTLGLGILISYADESR